MRIARLCLVVLAVFTLAAAASAQRRFACADYSQGKVFIVAADGPVEWEYDAPACDDLTVLPNGNMLFVTGHGAKEVTPDKKVVWEYNTPSEVYGCQRLPNGNTFVAECNAGRLLEIAPDGKIVHELRLLPEGTDGGHVYMRNARKLPNGHYLVAHSGAQVVKEYDAEGKVVCEIPAPGGPHSVQRLRNGNTVLSNWLGHGHFGEQPHIIEVTKDKKVVWTFADHKTMRTVSFFQELGGKKK